VGRSQPSEMSRVEAEDDVERWASDSRKYPTAPRHAEYKTPVLSSTSSSGRDGLGPPNAHPGVPYIHDDDSGLEEDWTNSSKLVV
jgi:hypothetical protein